MSLIRWAFLVGLTALVSACGGGPPAKTANEEKSDGPREEGKPGLDVSSEIGALDEDKVTKTFSASVKDLQGCLDQGAKRVEFLSGSVAFFLKIDQNGKVAHAHLEESTLGDRETEKCMLSALGRKEWPAPVGGLTGLARKSFDFDPPNDVRPPTEWNAGAISSALGEKKGELEKCTQGSEATFTATMYVSTEGKVLAAGVAPPDEPGEQAVDCLVDVLKGTTFPSPGSWPAKVTFRL